MIKQDDILDIKIEKVVFEGAGLAKAKEKAIFIKGVLPDEVVRARAIRVNKNFISGSLIEVMQASKNRIKPVCPYYKPCGACDFAFIDYDYQTELKEKIIKEIFQNFDIEFKPVIKSPKTKNYRMKTQYPVSITKNSKRIIIGYYKEKTHEAVNIKYCPIQPSVIDEIAEFIRNNWILGCYIEKKEKGLLRHVNFRSSNTNKDLLLTFVLNADEKGLNGFKNEINDFACTIIKKFPSIKGFFVNLNNKKTNKITGDKTILIKGEGFIFEKLEDKIYKIGGNSFFQVNPSCTSLLFNAARELIENKGTLLDLYGGLGTIGIFMKDKATKITLVEENEEAVCLAKENFKLNNVLKYEVFKGCAKEIMKKFLKEKRTFENIVIDPPRKGSDIETLQNISKMTNSIIYISCNPMTLKRDASELISLEFDFISIRPVDMFPDTHHIECVAKFGKRTEKNLKK